MKKSAFIVLIILVCVLAATAIAFSVLSIVGAFKPLEYVEAKSPTCTEQGNISHYINPINGLLYLDINGENMLTKDNIAIPALGHSLKHNDAELPSCTQDGNIEYWECMVCGKYFIDERGDNQVTDVKDGNSFGHTYNADISLGEWQWTGDSKSALFKYSCSFCGELQSVKATVSATEIPAECNKNGLNAYKATVNIGGKEYRNEKQLEIPLLGHDFSKDYTIDKSPTCTEAGSKSKHCSRCDAQEDITEIPQSEHSYESSVTKPTFTMQGYTTYSCTNCSYSYTADYVDAYLTFSLSQQDGCSYYVSGCSITESMSVIIPETYKGYPVTAVGQSAFKDNDYITNVSLSSSVSSIGAYAFASCSALKSVVLTDGVASIGDRAFYGCGNLQSIHYSGALQDWYKINGLSNLTQYGAVNRLLIADGKSYPICTLCDGVGNTKDFVGGCGAENHPYLITNSLQLINIEKDTDVYYKLANDINASDVANWEPIGGAYLEKAFNGVLDGDGHKISGLSRSSNILEKSNRSYFGLFGCVGEKGVIKNIVFDKINIRITGPANNNSSMRAFYGVVAGKCMGKVSNVELNGSFVYACCTNGCSYLGGICGYAVNAEIYYCKNNIDLAGDRYAAQVGGIVSVAEGGIIGYCENTGDITVYCSTGGVAFAGGICAVGHSVNTPRLISNVNSGKLKVGHYPATVGGNLRTGETDFAWKENVTY